MRIIRFVAFPANHDCPLRQAVLDDTSRSEMLRFNVFLDQSGLPE